MKTKILLAIISITYHTLSFASGCGGYPGYKIINLKVVKSEQIKEEDFKVIAYGPGFIQVRHNAKNITLIGHTEFNRNTNVSSFKKGSLLSQQITYENYDGCDDYYHEGRKRLLYKTKRGRLYSWPYIFEHDLTTWPVFSY